MASMPSTSSEMSVLCRCCLQEKDDLISLLKVVSEKIPLNYAAVVKKCVGVEITMGDGLPSQICTGCSVEAERFYKFKGMCLSSEQKLRPTAALELVFNEVACQTDECYQKREVGESLKDVEKQDNSKGVFPGSCEDLNISLSVEIKDVGVTGDQSLNKTLENPSDLTLSEESILSVLDMEKNKVSDVLEENELPSLSSPVSDGDLSNWLAENQDEIKESEEFAEQDNSACGGNKESGDGNLANPPSSDRTTSEEKQNDSKEKEAEKEDLNRDSTDKDSDKLLIDQNVEQGERAEISKNEEAKSLVESVSENLKNSVEGRVTVKSLQDLTYDSKSIPQAAAMPSGFSITAPGELEFSGSEKDNEVPLNESEDVEKSDMIPTSSTSCDSKIPIASEPQNAVEDTTSRTKDQSMDSLSKENNGIPTPVKTVSDDQMDAAGDKSGVEEPSGDSLAPSGKGVSCMESIPENSGKRPREEASSDVNITEGSCGPKRSRTDEEAVVSKEPTEEVSMKDGDNEISSSEQPTSIEDGKGEEVNAADDGTGGTDEMNSSKKGEEEVNNELGQPDNFSDEDIMGDDGCTYDSSGSEYVPIDSPALSEDSSRPLRPRTGPKTREKHSTNKLRVQGFSIRECRVVLSDIARPGSSALTNSNSMSSHVSVSSLKSIDNDGDNVKNTEKEEDGKEADGLSENTSSCTAWIKVEPEDMEEMESEAAEENNLGSEEVDSGTVEQGMASSTNTSAETPEGATAENQTILTRVVGGRRRFLCPFCAKGFHTRNQMILHRGVHTGDLPYGCEVCGKRFALRCRLLRHMSVHDASIVCEFCGMDFKTNIMLGRHIKAKHTIPSYTFPPPHSVAVSSMKSSIKNSAPVPAPHNKTVQRFPCRLCPRVFSSMNGLKGHKRAHKNHPLKVPGVASNPVEQKVEQKVEQNVCTICGMSFPNALYLKSHMVCHTIMRPNSGKVNSIEIPGTSSGAEESPQKVASNLKVPEESINVMEPTVLIHESPSAFGDSPYQYNQPGMMMQNVCSVCSQIFPTQEKLLRHQVLANHSKTWNCEDCPAMFSNSVQLQNHILSQHPAKSNFMKEYKCNICGKVFSKSSRLNQHMSYHITASESVTCQLCGKYFASVEQLNMHKKVHESAPVRGMNSDLCCSVCRRVFSKRSRLKRHMILHESQSFPCSKCSKTFISEELLTEHQLHHTQNVTQPPVSQPASVPQSPVDSEDVSGGIPCTACGRIFTNRARLKQHVVVHTKSGFVACQNCFKVFANGQMLEMHAAVCANTEEGSNGSQSNVSSKSASIPHPSGFASCTSCGKAFPSKELLTEHEKTCVGRTVVKKLDGTWKVMENADDRSRVSSISSGSSNSSRSIQQNASMDTMVETKTYSCKSCGKSFNNYHGLNSHMRFHQENAGTYKCELCSKLFPSRNKLTQHMSSHSAVYRCGICSQAFGLVDELKKHVSQCVAAQKGGTTSNYYHCTGCSEVFSLLEQLAAHIRCHGDEFPHACHECYKVFANQAQLNRHMTTHANQNQSRNVCKICNKTFNNNASLEKHVVVHTGEKKFECPYCMQRFSQRSSLHRHKLTQHETKM